MLETQIQAFLKQAVTTAKYANNAAETVTMTAILITPKGQYTALGVERFAEVGDFIQNRADVVQIRVRLQPGLYFNQIVPYRDDLTMQLIISSETDRVMREFVAVPLVDKDVKAEGNNSAEVNLDALNDTNIVPYEFQLINPGFAKLKNIPVSNVYQMATTGDVLATVMEKFTRNVGLTGWDAYKGMHFHQPIDNTNKYNSIEIPNGTKLINVPLLLQNHNDYGVYTKGMCCYYKQNYWWVVPTFNTELVETHTRPLDIIRVPSNKIPDLDSTFFRSDVGMTIIACGVGGHDDRSDIRKQNQGVGQRILMGDAIAGETGYHYTKGRAVTTRADSVQEYKLSERRDGEEWIPLDLNPTGNMCKPLSENAFNEGEIIEVEWRNGDVGFLEPGHPLRYQYMYSESEMVVRKGVLLGYRSDYKAITAYAKPMLKRTTILTLFVKRAGVYNTSFA